ncbi:cell growth-regulating nucleolar protein [Arapaima gigas]
MVFFTCNACGESLKKAQVDKHRAPCRAAQGLSCIDCGQDFWGDAYKTHIRCISEDQKYGGKGYEAKSNKGDVKQQQWMQRIHDAMNKPGISNILKNVLSQVKAYDNVPRKKAKFQNWMKNSLNIHDTALHNQVWEIFSAADDNMPSKQEQSKGSPPAENGNEEVHQNGNEEKHKKERRKERRVDESQLTEVGDQGGSAQGKKKKKRKREEEESREEEHDNSNSVEEEVQTRKQKKRKQNKEEAFLHSAPSLPPVSKGKFNWKGTIKAVLRQAPEEGVPMKKLRKKVLAAYYAFSGEENFRSEEELLSLFSKKVNSNPKFRVLKEKVRLIK